MSDNIEKKLSLRERQTAAFQQAAEFARLHAEAQKKARDEKTARLKAMRLAKQKGN